MYNKHTKVKIAKSTEELKLRKSSSTNKDTKHKQSPTKSKITYRKEYQNRIIEIRENEKVITYFQSKGDAGYNLPVRHPKGLPFTTYKGQCPVRFFKGRNKLI